MNYLCGRCNGRFKSKKYLENHIKLNKIPCDFFCDKCGWKGSNQSAIVRHLQEPCTIKETKEPIILKPQVLPLQRDMSLELSREQHINEECKINQKTSNNVGKNDQEISNDPDEKLLTYIRLTKYRNIELQLNNINIETVSTIGIVPIGKQYKKLYKNLTKYLYHYFYETLKEPFKGSIIKSSLIDKQLIEIIRLFYTNINNPEYMNIYQYEGKYYIFNGTKYVEDFLTKEYRYKYMLQIIVKYINKFIISLSGNDENDVDKYIVEHIKSKLITHIYEQYYTYRFANLIDCYLSNNYTILKSINYNTFPKNETLTIEYYKEQLDTILKEDFFIRNEIDKLLRLKGELEKKRFETSRIHRNIMMF